MSPTRAGIEIAVTDIDWRQHIAPGSLVIWGQGSAEPAALTASLMTHRAAIGRFRAFVGISWGDSVAPEHTDHVAFSSYCGTGRNSQLANRLDILPLSYSSLAPMLARERPVLLLSLGVGQGRNSFSFGAACEYLGDLLAHARLVIAQVSDDAPRGAAGGEFIAREQIDIVVRTNAPALSPPTFSIGPAERQIAARVAALVEDGSTLQIGLGAVPKAVIEALAAHRELGVHSGLIEEGIMALTERGVITNGRKAIDRGISVAGLLLGGADLLRWADANKSVKLRPTSYTHDPAVLSSIDRLVAINSAIEVDLTGQINAEVAGGRYVGAVGGAGDFLRGAHRSRGGLPIVALPSCAGNRTRIVAALSGPVSTGRADAGIIVTEHGVADLRGLDLRRRREAMLAIADPAHAVDLANAL